jgi:hypothetical protein
MEAAHRAGDLEAARAIHATIGRLLEPERPAELAPVVDLVSERRKRGAR